MTARPARPACPARWCVPVAPSGWHTKRKTLHFGTLLLVTYMAYYVDIIILIFLCDQCFQQIAQIEEPYKD